MHQMIFTPLLALNYKINQNHLLRAVYGKANRGAFFVDIFTNFSQEIGPGPIPNSVVTARVFGNESLHLLTSKSFEIGYRARLNEKSDFDLTVFRTEANNFNNLYQKTTIVPGNPTNIYTDVIKSNNDQKAIQTGATVSFKYQSKRSTLRPFVTLQFTQLKNFTPYFLFPESDQSGNMNITVQHDIDDYKNTPRLFGGFYYNYIISTKVKFNFNSYIFSGYEMTHRSDYTNNDNPDPLKIKTKILLNLKFSYVPVKQMTIFANIRNLLGQSSPEYYYTDKVGTDFITGLNFEF